MDIHIHLKKQFINIIHQIFDKQILFDICDIYSYSYIIQNHIHIYIFNTIVDTNYVSLQYKKNNFTIRIHHCRFKKYKNLRHNFTYC